MRRFLVIALAVGALLGVAGCGDDDEATQTSAQTSAAPAVATASDADKKKIEADVKKAGDEGAGASADSADTAGSGVIGCGDGLYVGPNTTCPFAENVRNAYEEDPEGGDYSVFSPVTGQTYPMTCVAGADFAHACTGANNASVFF